MTNSEKSWTEYFRVVTPMLLTIGIFMLGNIISIVNKVDDKLFKHLTNDEIHAPRSVYVSKTEFDLVSQIREKQFNKIDQVLCEIKAEVKEMRKEMR